MNTSFMAGIANSLRALDVRLPARKIACLLALLFATVSAQAQFTLDLRPAGPGAGELRFTLAPGYYYCLESSADLSGGFTPASGWMLGNETEATWLLHYPVEPTASGGNVTTNDTFSLYPFDNGKAVVSWRDLADVRYNAIVAADYSDLPPIVSILGSATSPGAMLLVGQIAWDPAYDLLTPSLLPAEQQAVFARLPSPAVALAAATPGGASGPGLIFDSEKHFFRIRRMALDADGDGLDWATETFQLGTDPEAANTPASLAALADADGIHLAWLGGTPGGGGTIIERRESMDTAGPFTAWHELHRIPSPQTNWLDTRLAPGEYAIYRVRFYFPFNGNEYHSAPGNLARAAMWIKYADGTWGTPGGDDGTGGDPVSDPPPPPDGGDDPVIPGDGDGDGDPDNDKDGVVDTHDRYPNDPLRSEDIPVKFYGVIDLSQYTFNGVPVPVQHVTYIAIDDGNSVSWLNEGEEVRTNTQISPTHSKSHHRRESQIVRWKDGTILEVTTRAYDYKGDLTWQNSEIYGPTDYELTEVFTDIDLAALNGG